MKRRVVLFLVVLIRYSNFAAAAEKGPGIVLYKSNGQSELAANFDDNSTNIKSTDVNFQTCKGRKVVAKRTEIEFFSQAEVCAKVNLSDYKDWLFKIRSFIPQNQNNLNRIFVMIPPEQNFEAAASLTREVFGKSVNIKRGNDLQIKAYLPEVPTDPTLFKKTPIIGPDVWVDKSGFFEIRELATLPKK